MSAQILSPITRIEGHLSIKTEIIDGKLANVQSCGEMYRGFENIMIDRHPLDAARIMQRICGVCHEVHGIAAAKALAQLYKIELPQNGKLMHDIILGIHIIHDHILHFYHLSVPDYIDFVALASYSGNDPALKGAKDWVKTVKPALYAQKVSGDYISEPAIALPFIVHYLEALELLGLAASALSLLGGKTPFCHTIFPGGVTTEITIEKLAKVSNIVDKLNSFVIAKYLPDVISIAKLYPEYWTIGSGYKNAICYGGFNSLGKLFFASGVIIDGNQTVFDKNKIVEDITHSYYQGTTQSFSTGETKPYYDKSGAYSWIKSPRYDGHPMETGPLSRIYVNYARYEGLSKIMFELKQPKEALFSTLGRHLARAFESIILGEFVQEALSSINVNEPTIKDIDMSSSVSDTGLGLSNAGRGELLHFIETKNGRVLRYNCIVPSTWNFSPKDSAGKHGPVEKALENTPVRFEKGMIEAGRVIRSYDPCLACSIH